MAILTLGIPCCACYVFVRFLNVVSRSLFIYKECLGPGHNDVGSALNLLAVVVGEQGRYLEVSAALRVYVILGDLFVCMGATNSRISQCLVRDHGILKDRAESCPMTLTECNFRGVLPCANLNTSQSR